jgi:hypothetical protein
MNVASKDDAQSNHATHTHKADRRDEKPRHEKKRKKKGKKSFFFFPVFARLTSGSLSLCGALAGVCFFRGLYQAAFQNSDSNAA